MRNNREYDLLKKEIEFQSLEVELQKKRIGQATSAIEAKKADIVNGEAVLKERRIDLDVKKSELGEIIAETKAEEEKLMEKAKHLELSTCNATLAAVVSTKSRPSANLTSVCAKKLSYVNTADVS